MPLRGGVSAQNAELVRACADELAFIRRTPAQRAGELEGMDSDGREFGPGIRVADFPVWEIAIAVRNLQRTSGDSGSNADPACGKSFPTLAAETLRTLGSGSKTL
jgi:hypothetical protein